MISRISIRPDFYRNILWELYLIVFLVFSIIVLVQFLKTHKKAKAAAKTKSTKTVSKELNPIKKKYIDDVKKVEKLYNKEQITDRNCYQSLSIILRDFVKEFTGIDTTTKTLEEIRKMNMSSLAEVLDEYYEPEFAHTTKLDAPGAIKKAAKVIEKWK